MCSPTSAYASGNVCPRLLLAARPVLPQRAGRGRGGRRAPAVFAESPPFSCSAPRPVTKSLFCRAPPLRNWTSLCGTGVSVYAGPTQTTLLVLLAPTADGGGTVVRCSGRCSPVAGRDPVPTRWGSGTRWPRVVHSLPALG